MRWDLLQEGLLRNKFARFCGWFVVHRGLLILNAPAHLSTNSKGSCAARDILRSMPLRRAYDMFKPAIQGPCLWLLPLHRLAYFQPSAASVVVLEINPIYTAARLKMALPVVEAPSSQIFGRFRLLRLNSPAISVVLLSSLPHILPIPR